MSQCMYTEVYSSAYRPRVPLTPLLYCILIGPECQPSPSLAPSLFAGDIDVYSMPEMPPKSSAKPATVNSKSASIPNRIKEVSPLNPAVPAQVNGASRSSGRPDKVVYEREQAGFKAEIDSLQARLVSDRLTSPAVLISILQLIVIQISLRLGRRAQPDWWSERWTRQQ